MIGVAFKYGHHVDKALERFESKNCSNLHRVLGQRRFVIPIHRSRVRTTDSFGWPRVDYPHCILDDRPPRPGTRPFFENRVAFHRVLEPGNKALLSLLTSRGE